MRIIVLLAKKTSVLHICNGASVLLIDICASEPVLLFAMGASATSALFGEDMHVLFLRFRHTSAP